MTSSGLIPLHVLEPADKALRKFSGVFSCTGKPTLFLRAPKRSGTGKNLFYSEESLHPSGGIPFGPLSGRTVSTLMCNGA